MQEKFFSDGYIIKKEFLSKTMIFNLLEEIHQVFKSRLKTINFEYTETKDSLLSDDDFFKFFQKNPEDYISCMKTIHNLPTIFEIGSSDKVIQVLKSIGLKKPIFSSIPMINLHNKRVAADEGYWKTPIHQDWRSVQGSLNCAVVWISLVDINEDLGALEVLPRSHLKGLLPADEDDWYMHVKDGIINEEEFVSVPMKAGDALFFSAFLIHRSGTNITEKLRYSLQFRYNDISEPTFIERGYPNPYNSVRPQRELITPNFPDKKDVENFFSNTN